MSFFISHVRSTRDAHISPRAEGPRSNMGLGLIWHVGKNKLGCMMSEFSKIAKLSKKYTKHCIRATAITALDQAGFAPRHIMSVSGHRSEESIKNYSRKTSTDQKRKMSETLGKLIPLNSGCTTIDENEADNFEKKH